MPKKRRDSKKKTSEKGIYRLNNSRNGYLVRVTMRHPHTGNTVYRQKKIQAESINAAILVRESLREQMKKEVNRATYGAVTPLSSLTVRDLWEHYLQDRQKHIKPITYRQLTLMFGWFVEPILGDTRVDEITRSTVKWYRSQLSKLQKDSGESYSNHTLKQADRVLSGFIRWAYSEEIIDRDPYRALSPIRAGTRAKEKDTLSFEEAMLFLNQGKHHIALKHYTMICMAIVGGSRHGELAALTWDDVDFDAGIIYVTKTVTAQRLSNTTKTGSNNVLIMLPQIRMLLKELKRGQKQEKNPLNLVFPSRSLGKYREAPSINWAIRKLLRVFEIEKNITVHGLRHSAISILIQQGVNAEIVRKVVGHAPGSKVTLQYLHADRQITAKSLNRVWEAFAP